MERKRRKDGDTTRRIIDLQALAPSNKKGEAEACTSCVHAYILGRGNRHFTSFPFLLDSFFLFLPLV